jgi:putative oxidoreductase
MKNLIPTRIAVIVFGLVFIVFGINHFMNAGKMTGYVPSMFPSPGVFVYISGAGLLLAGLAFIINRFAKIAGYLLALLLLIIVCTIHLPGMMNAADEGMKSMFLSNFLKDIGLTMAAIIIANISRQ